MANSKDHFLYILLLILATQSQILFPINNCLGNCSNCSPYDLALCKGDSPCEWGYQNSPSNGQCLIQPSLQVVSNELGQRRDNNSLKLRDGWVGNSSLSICQYSSPSGKKYIDVLGFFTGASSLQKTFQVNSSSQIFQLSFNLLRDEWLPFSDFLTVNISSQSVNIQSLSISYGSRIKVESQSTSLICSGKSVISEKINMKIINNKQIGNQLKVVFTSSLYNSMWALTNIKLIEGCVGSFRFDLSKGICIQKEEINASNKKYQIKQLNSSKKVAINASLSKLNKKDSLSNSSNLNITNNTIKITTNQSSVVRTSNYLIVEDQVNQSLQLSSPHIEYIPFSVQSKSGLKLLISGISSDQVSNLVVKIDKLETYQYQIHSLSEGNSNLNIFLAINTSFIDGILTINNNSSKTLSLIASVNINRFDFLSVHQLSNITSLAIFFEICSWIGVVLIICTILIGCGIIFEQYIIVLQIIFLHVYIVPDYLPLTFRDVIGGLNRILSLNFFTPNTRQFIKSFLMGNVVQSGPIRFSLFSTDINFSRAFYPIVIINIIYLFWFAILFFSKRYLLSKNNQGEQKHFLFPLINKIVGRSLNFADMVWRYQFLATVWFCFIQFYSLKYPNDSNRSQTINSILCILSCICTLIWPLFVNYYCRQSYYEITYSQFRLKFSDIYFGKICEYSLPSIHHRIGYPIFRTIKMLLIALVIAYLGNIPTVTLSFLCLINIMEVIYCKSHQIFTDQQYFIFKIIENGLLIILDAALLIMCIFNQISTTEWFIGVGYFLSSLALLVVVNAFIRAVYIGQKKYGQMLGTDKLNYQDKNNPMSQKIVV